MAWPVPERLPSTSIPRIFMNLFMALRNTRNASREMKPASDFFLLARPTLRPTQKITPRFVRMALSEPDSRVPNPMVTGLFKNGRTACSRGLVNRLPTAIRIPAMGRIRTGINIALENRCNASMTLSFMGLTPSFVLHFSDIVLARDASIHTYPAGIVPLLSHKNLQL